MGEVFIHSKIHLKVKIDALVHILFQWAGLESLLGWFWPLGLIYV